MAKKKKRKNKFRNNKNNHKNIKEDLPNPGRRRFLIGAAAAGAVVGSGVLYKLYDYHYGTWNFLNRTSDDVDRGVLSWREVKRCFIHFGDADYDLKGDTLRGKELFPSLKEHLTREIKRRGYDMGGNYDITCKQNLFGVPSPERYAKRVIEYCKKAVEFMHDRLPALDRQDINFVVLKPGSTYTKDTDNTIFIGDMYYSVYTFDCVNENDPKQRISDVKSCNGNRGALGHIINDVKTPGIEKWYAFVPSNDIALMAPFSELIPLTTIRATTRYDRSSRKIDSATAIIAEETISEGLSHVLSKQIVKEMDIPNGLEIIAELDRGIFDKQPQYVHVPAAVRWIRRNGMRQALELYMEDPAKFLEAIKRN